MSRANNVCRTSAWKMKIKRFFFRAHHRLRGSSTRRRLLVACCDLFRTGQNDEKFTPAIAHGHKVGVAVSPRAIHHRILSFPQPRMAERSEFQLRRSRRVTRRTDEKTKRTPAHAYTLGTIFSDGSSDTRSIAIIYVSAEPWRSFFTHKSVGSRSTREFAESDRADDETKRLKRQNKYIVKRDDSISNDCRG